MFRFLYTHIDMFLYNKYFIILQVLNNLVYIFRKYCLDIFYIMRL